MTTLSWREQTLKASKYIKVELWDRDWLHGFRILRCINSCNKHDTLITRFQFLVFLEYPNPVKTLSDALVIWNHIDVNFHKFILHSYCWSKLLIWTSSLSVKSVFLSFFFWVIIASFTVTSPYFTNEQHFSPEKRIKLLMLSYLFGYLKVLAEWIWRFKDFSSSSKEILHLALSVCLSDDLSFYLSVDLSVYHE